MRRPPPDLTRALVLAIVVAVSGCGFIPRRQLAASETDLLEAAPKPAPLDSAFDGCDANGSPPDGFLNLRKNRVDEPRDFLPVRWRVVARLPWPATVGYRFRNLWTRGEQRDVARFEGAAVRVDGYLAGERLEIPEPPNCYSRDPAHRDFHLWFTEHPHGRERDAIVVEITPRVRARHPEWTLSRIAALVRDQRPVRVSGWLMLDQMHPELVRVNRVTMWEIHPVMRLEVRQPDGRWVELGDLPP